ncbi:hypothetical protein HY994_02145 [Candidatus Micrarchaeota archaeon]|nr:hypothetical protein [Candidatus Micrarchaeota archaeon]
MEKKREVKKSPGLPNASDSFLKSMRDFGKDRAEDNEIIRTIYGWRPDLKLKQEAKEAFAKGELSNGYYSVETTPLEYKFNIPVDLDDLEAAIKHDGILTDFTGKLTVKIPVDSLESLMVAYPRECKKCGYAKFHYLEYFRCSIGSDASFKCPYCELKTELNWADKW